MAKWLTRAVLAVSAVALTSALAPGAASAGEPANAAASANQKVLVCHATSSTNNPYVSILVADDSTLLEAHEAHEGDIIEPPSGNCSELGSGGGANDPITICHATGSATNPWSAITVDQNSAAAQAHAAHEDDFIPTLDKVCPDGPGYTPRDTTTTIVASEAPTTTSTTLAKSLPVSGSSGIGRTLLIGFVVLLVGTDAVLIARRRRVSPALA